MFHLLCSLLCNWHPLLRNCHATLQKWQVVVAAAASSAVMVGAGTMGIPLLFKKPSVFPYLIFMDFCDSYIFRTCIRILGGIVQIINLSYRSVAIVKSSFLP